MALDDTETLVCRSLGEMQAEMEACLADLVDIDSPTDDAESVNAVGRRCEEHLIGSGLRGAAFVTGRGGQHVVARTNADSGNRLLLLGHLDTVFPADPNRPGFRVDEDHPDRLRGPGVADMKGGLVVILFAIRALAKHGLLADRALTVLLTADEETGSPTCRDIIRAEAAESHLCLVFECGTPDHGNRTLFVTRRKGAGRLTMRVRGVASHAGAAFHEGISAIMEAARKTVALGALTDPSAGMTVNVGVIRGGTTANTVPDLAEMEVDYRFWTPKDGQTLMASIEEIAEDTFTIEPGAQRLRTEIIRGPEHPPLVPTEASERMARRIIEWGRDLGLELGTESRGGASDGNIAAAECPTIDGLGVVGRHMHSPREWMARRSLVDRARLLAITMNRFYRLQPRSPE